MKRSLLALPTVGALLAAEAAHACPPSETDLVVAGGIVLVTGAVILGTLVGITLALARLVRRRMSRGASFVANA